jgi:hypothetical protein
VTGQARPAGVAATDRGTDVRHDRRRRIGPRRELRVDAGGHRVAAQHVVRVVGRVVDGRLDRAAVTGILVEEDAVDHAAADGALRVERVDPPGRVERDVVQGPGRRGVDVAVHLDAAAHDGLRYRFEVGDVVGLTVADVQHHERRGRRRATSERDVEPVVGLEHVGELANRDAVACCGGRRGGGDKESRHRSQ